MKNLILDTEIEIEIEKEKLLRILSVATFLIFFQAYMVAPLIPRLAEIFMVSPHKMGFIVPVYMIPYGIATLFFGFLSDRLGRKTIFLSSMFAFTLLMALTATAQSADQMLFWRLLSGIGISGVVPLALILIGINYPYEKRGRPLGWIFAAMAGGMAFGSTLGAVLEPIIGWRYTFLAVSITGVLVLISIWPYRNLLGKKADQHTVKISGLFNSYREILSSTRSKTIYIFVFLNAIFHSGVFTWLGLYLTKYYSVGTTEIGIIILGWGLPGFLFGPYLGKLADRYGRKWLIPTGLAIAAISAGILILKPAILIVSIAVAVLSLGFDMTQPLFAGIVTSLSSTRPGQAMGLNVFLLFTGFGIGSLLFGEAVNRIGFDYSLLAFALLQIILAIISLRKFRLE